MGKFIIHHNGVFNFYSTISDGCSFVSGLTREQVTRAIKEEEGERGLFGVDARISRAIRYGTSCNMGTTLADAIGCNRAGEDEAELSFDEFVDQYLTIKEYCTQDCDWKEQCHRLGELIGKPCQHEDIIDENKPHWLCLSCGKRHKHMKIVSHTAADGEIIDAWTYCYYCGHKKPNFVGTAVDYDFFWDYFYANGKQIGGHCHG